MHVIVETDQGPRAVRLVPLGDGSYALACAISGSTVNLIAAPSGPNGQFGYQQITGDDLAAAYHLQPPAGATQATIIVEGGEVRYRADGIDPTTTVGMPLTQGSILTLNGGELAARFIAIDEGAILNIWWEG